MWLLSLWTLSYSKIMCLFKPCVYLFYICRRLNIKQEVIKIFCNQNHPPFNEKWTTYPALPAYNSGSPQWHFHSWPECCRQSYSLFLPCRTHHGCTPSQVSAHSHHGCLQEEKTKIIWTYYKHFISVGWLNNFFLSNS